MQNLNMELVIMQSIVQSECEIIVVDAAWTISNIKQNT